MGAIEKSAVWCRLGLILGHGYTHEVCSPFNQNSTVGTLAFVGAF